LFISGWPTRSDVILDIKVLLVADPEVDGQQWFVPFSEIPALADIADAPIEWATAGVTHHTSLPFDSPAGDYGYELRVSCPSGSCTAVGPSVAAPCEFTSPL
jgi:hypothetical protein